MRQFHLEIVTPDGLAFDGECESVAVKTTAGDVQIMYAHEDYFAPLAIGIARIKCDGNTRTASAQGGFISVKDKSVRIVATTFEFSENIDIARAENAKARAEEALRDAKNEKEAAIQRARLARALNRLSAGKM